MEKYKFSSTERFVIWKTYSYRCFHCGQPLKWRDLTVDHLLPECLLYRPDYFDAIKDEYSLKSDYSINEFGNWVPAHDRCNNRKSNFVPYRSELFAKKIEKVIIFSNIARKVFDRLLKQRHKDKILAKILSKLENSTINTADLYQLIEKSTILYFGLPETEPEDIIHVPDKWKIMRINKQKKYLTVTDGQRMGIVPMAYHPHTSWRCPSCKRYGPWNENKCLACGNVHQNE